MLKILANVGNDGHDMIVQTDVFDKIKSIRERRSETRYLDHDE